MATTNQQAQPLFPQGYRGLADSRWSGVQGSVAESVGIDPHSTPGLIKVHQSLERDDGEVINELCKNVVQAPDGSRLYFSSESGKIWREFEGTYTLVDTTEFLPFDISTAGDTGKTLNTSGQSINQASIAGISTTGNRLIVLRQSENTIHQYNLSTNFDLSTATHNSSFNHGSQTDTSQSAFVRQDGLKMYITSSSTVYQYTLGTAWSISTASYDSVSYTLPTSGGYGINFSTDGTKMYRILNTTTGEIQEFSLSTPWVVSTASVVDTFTPGSEVGSGQFGLTFSPDGENMYIFNFAPTAKGGVYQYQLSTAWDITSAIFFAFKEILVDGSTPLTGVFSQTGEHLYVGIVNDSLVVQYGLDDGSDTNVETISAELHLDRIYYATKNKLLSVSVDNLDPFLSSVVGDFENGSEYHPMVKQNLNLFIGDETVIAEVDFNGTFVQQTPLTIPEDETIVSLAPFDVDIVIGTVRGNYGRILRWDTFAESWSAEDIVFEKGVWAFLRDDNFLYAYAGEQGQWYFYNGEQLERIQKVPGTWRTETATVHHKATNFYQGLPVFGLSSVDGEPCKMGVYSFGRYSRNYNPQLNLSFPIGDTYNDLQIGAIHVDGVDMYVATDQGIYKLDHNKKYEHAHIETRQLTPLQERSRNSTKAEFLVDYTSLPEDTNVKTSYRNRYDANFVEVPNQNNTVLEQIRSQVSVNDITSLQLRFDIETNGNDAPEIESISTR